MWLAAAGWGVSAADVCVTALDHARSTAKTLGEDIVERSDRVAGDLGTWTRRRRGFV